MAADSYNLQNKTSLCLSDTFNDSIYNNTQYPFLKALCFLRATERPGRKWYLFVYFGPAFDLGYDHSHDASPEGGSEGEELLVGGDVLIPWVWVPAVKWQKGEHSWNGRAQKSAHQSFKVSSKVSLRTCTITSLKGYKHVYCTFDKIIQTMTAASTGKPSEDDSYSMGNQSPQSSLTLSMSLWQRKRSWTSLRAVGGTTSLIHTCRDQRREKTWWGLVSPSVTIKQTSINVGESWLNIASVVKKKYWQADSKCYLQRGEAIYTHRNQRWIQLQIFIEICVDCFDRLDSNNSKAARNLKGFHLKPI